MPWEGVGSGAEPHTLPRSHPLSPPRSLTGSSLTPSVWGLSGGPSHGQDWFILNHWRLAASPAPIPGGQRSGAGLKFPLATTPPPPLLLTCHLSGVNPGEIERGLLCITDAPLTLSFRKSQGFKSSIQKSG